MKNHRFKSEIPENVTAKMLREDGDLRVRMVSGFGTAAVRKRMGLKDNEPMPVRLRSMSGSRRPTVETKWTSK